MSDPCAAALAQIEAAEFTPKTLLAAKRLLAAADQRTGSLKANREQAGKILGTGSWGATRRMLVAIKKSGLIHYSTNELVYVDFCAWPSRGAESDLQRSKSDLERSPDDDREGDGRALEITFRSPEIEKRAPEITSDPSTYTHASAHDGSEVGRYIQTLNPDLPEDQYLPTASPETEKLTPEQQRSFAMLTDPDVGMIRGNALKCARLHTFSYIVKQTATWYVSRRERGAGALLKRLSDWGNFPPYSPVPDAFLESELYRRHYPLDLDQQADWKYYQMYEFSRGAILGMEDSVEAVNAWPDELFDLVELLPVPIFVEGVTP